MTWVTGLCDGGLDRLASLTIVTGESTVIVPDTLVGTSKPGSVLLMRGMRVLKECWSLHIVVTVTFEGSELDAVDV